MLRWTVVPLICLFLATAAISQDETPGPEITIDPFVMCEDVVNREPVNVTDFFRADGTATSFTRIFASAPTRISHVWYHENTRMDEIPFTVQPPSWRVWSRKHLYGKTGIWRVEVVDENGTVLRTTHFQAE